MHFSVSLSPIQWCYADKPRCAVLQSSVENQAEADASLVAAAIKLATGRPAGRAQGQSPAAGSAAPGKAGAVAGGASVPVEVQVACLRAIQEYVALCHRLKILPPLLEEIEVCAC